jgi:hypothetical protein
MKSKVAALILAAGSVASAQMITHQSVSANTVVPVATALNHLSLIELPEPIVRAAVGSEDVRVEWHGNTVVVKPVRQGQSTNLFVWTEHTQSTYEILPPGDVSHASFVIDQSNGHPSVPATNSADAAVKVSDAEIQKAADTLIAQAMLQSSEVNSRGIKDAKDHVNVRITEVVHDKDAMYVRYTVSNPGQHPYRISDPTVYSFNPAGSHEAVGSLKGLQIPEQKLASFGSGTTSSLIVREGRLSNRDVNPGESVDGVLCVKNNQNNPQVYRFVFANDDTHPVNAAAVL